MCLSFVRGLLRGPLGMRQISSRAIAAKAGRQNFRDLVDRGHGRREGGGHFERVTRGPADSPACQGFSNQHLTGCAQQPRGGGPIHSIFIQPH